MDISEHEWQRLCLQLPVGTDVACDVAHLAPFGFFVTILAHPHVSAVVLAPDFFRPHRERTDFDDYPAIGSRFVAEVVHHVDVARQIQLRVGSHVVISTPSSSRGGGGGSRAPASENREHVGR